MKDKIFKYLENEEIRVNNNYNLIASENLPSKDCLRALGHLINFKYSEGNVRKRYYQGNINVDLIENECKNRAKKLFKCKYANVQPIGGSAMNLALISFMLNPGDTILSMDLKSGGHLSHGSSVNFVGKTYKIISYGVDKNGKIDYNELNELAQKFKPRMIISGATCYSRKINFKKIGEIADSVDAFHVSDISHIAGLIVAGFHQSPIKYADFVTTTTHKTLRGVRGGIILSNNDEYKDLINKIIFPHFQGGPHSNIMAANAIALREATLQKFKSYIKKVLENTSYLCNKLKDYGFKIVGGKTENHLILIDLSPLKIDGRRAAELLEKNGIVLNANAIPNDKNSLWRPSGIRLGMALETTKGITKKEIDNISEKIKNLLMSNSLKGKKHSKQRRENISKALKNAYKKGTKTQYSGIVSKGKQGRMMYSGKRIYISHYVWFKNTGNFPKKGEVIHHKDFNQSNNSFDNLELMTSSKHIKLHTQIRKNGIN